MTGQTFLIGFRILSGIPCPFTLPTRARFFGNLNAGARTGNTLPCPGYRCFLEISALVAARMQDKTGGATADFVMQEFKQNTE
jgi:hypothetical protein